MEPSDNRNKIFIRNLLLSRMRILCNHGFYGILLMNMKFGLDENPENKTAYTDGEGIYFNPDFLGSLNEQELDFVLMHELLHVVLQHCSRGSDFQRENFNIACDIVVNSTILKANDMDEASVSVGGVPSMHIAPDGNEGYGYTAEQVCQMLSDSRRHRPSTMFKDDHSKWKSRTDSGIPLDEVWRGRVIAACRCLDERKCGNIPLEIERMYRNLTNPQLDWKTLLIDFIQTEVCDYSFIPPDRRYGTEDFFLPDYNVTADRIQNVLFMIDTSGSVSDEMLTAAFSEIKGAVDQFSGAFEGLLGFFDCKVTTPVPFNDVRSLKIIHPKGGGGTSFQAIFDYIRENMRGQLPCSIVILTDGYAPFPKKEDAMGIPVLWLINNDKITPPWGRNARIISDNDVGRLTDFRRQQNRSVA